MPWRGEWIHIQLAWWPTYSNCKHVNIRAHFENQTFFHTLQFLALNLNIGAVINLFHMLLMALYYTRYRVLDDCFRCTVYVLLSYICMTCSKSYSHFD
jgi:hypothetical protein